MIQLPLMLMAALYDRLINVQLHICGSNLCLYGIEATCTELCVCVCTYLGCLWCAGYVDSAWFDSVCFGALEERKAALPPPAVSVWERAIVPVQIHTSILTTKASINH